ncbi:menaquinone biosynthetic enzyme MqnA/MqnD family protein [Tepidibacillus fermentans]|uniref:Chorismate dehydratase n=1 Tax=Tepidibacillus fermentans TaxID=1281767 RepID=A0A4R3KKV5_9BACI|nr:menaquinone biosynthesis protein [Tepidibacillus fermentans]TCS84142.1 futalosine synthase [Tepidibacillus fermentans]
MSKLRIGRITYTNIWPIYHFFDHSQFQNEIELIPQVPSQLNQRMKDGTIDMGAISAFAYAEQAENYVLLPNLSVSAYGRVGSISLFLKSDLEDIKNKKIALTNTSATSVHLVKIILEGFLDGKPEYITMEPDLEQMMKVADAALLIGDEALTQGWENGRTQKYQVIDLGEEWKKRTGLWMTFAVWAVRKNVVEQYPDLLYRVYHAFLNSKKKGYQKRNLIVQESMSRFGGTKQFWEDYFHGLSYDFSDPQIHGLNHYYQMAQQIGVLKKAPKIEILNMEKLTEIHTY